ncbi:hypothetical protein HC928_24050 [bacterium]|nr:hypothetical protein [bacterium]
MEKPTIPTLPVRQVTRKRIFAMRLTDRERAEIEALAKQLKLPDSYMARHFIFRGSEIPQEPDHAGGSR